MAKRLFGVLSYVGMLLVFGALAVRSLRPEWDQYAVYAAWTGLALVVLYTVSQWREIAAHFRQRNARYGAVAGVGVLVVLGILIAVNYLANRRNTRWDLTANKQYTLSEQTVKLLQGLNSPMKFYVFDRETDFDRFRPRLDSYRYNSNQVQVEYVDADRRPVQAKQYNVESYGTVVLEYMGRTERVTSDSEQDLTNALIKLLNPSQRKVYFLSGHAEKDPSSSEQDGYSAISDALKRDNYQFDKLILAQQELPADATVIVVAGPRTDLLPGEADKLKGYLAKGGHLLVMLDPPDKDPRPMPVLEGLLKEWSVTAGNDVVVDVSGVGQLLGTDISVPVAAKYSSHPITNNFSVLTAYPLARSVTADTGGSSGRSPQILIETSPRSWAETNVRELFATGKVELNEQAGDKPGPVSIGVAVSAPVADTSSADASKTADASKPAEGGDTPKPETRVVVIGDSDFATNSVIGIQGNRDIFMNTVNWLAQQENLIAIRPREAADRRITLTGSSATGMFWMSIIVVPAIVLGAGVFTWWRRR
jgi:ABC-type uncharacterized transport system involved in gliding motility auxiliary subunit